MKNELINIQDKEGQLVVTSRQVAEHFEKRHDHVTRDIENIISSGCAQNWGDLFIETEYQHEQNKQLYKEYLLTRDGFTLLAMGFTGTKGLEWKLKYIEAFKKMEQKITNPYQNISTEMKALLMQDEKLVFIESRVDKLEDDIHITRSQQKQLNYFAREVIVKALGSKYSAAYEEFSKRAFSEFWKSYQNAFNLASYMDTPKKDFQAALNFINGWKPSRELVCMIIGANTTIRED